MNFKKLQEMQQALDDAILKEKPEMTAEERYEKTCVALSVEVAELANTAEHFKFWKDNKGKVDSQRFEKMNAPEYMKGKIEIKYWDNNKNTCITLEQAHKLTLVEEASDCLHFILSLANQMSYRIDGTGIHYEYQEEKDATEESCLLFFNRILTTLAEYLGNDPTLEMLLDIFFIYIRKLGITQEELEQAYYDKNEINYQRLREGY